MPPAPIIPVRLTPADAARYARLRLRMLRDAPWAFDADPAGDEKAEAARLTILLADADAATFAVEAAPASGEADPPLIAAATVMRGPAPKFAHRARISAVFVDADRRGRGLGAAVMDAAMGCARGWGVEFIDLGVSENSPAAQRLYERMGFRAWGREPEATEHAGRRHDEIHMTLRLQSHIHNPPLLMAESPSSPRGPLDGLRVLDLSRVLAGPLCTMVLGDLGARVVKVERPGSGDDTRSWGPPWAEGPDGREAAYFLCVNRNKRSVEADLKSEEGRALVLRLARSADVLVENFAPGTLDGWGLGYEALSRENPGLVFCSITGYGSDGPEAGRPGYDFAVQARAGWMAVTGEAEGAPTKAGVAIVDVLTGQNAAVAILAALRERDRSGRGQRVEVALFDSAVAGLINVTQAALVTGDEPRRWGNAHPTIVPYQAFLGADRAFVVAVGNDAQWRRLCAAVGADELGADARLATNPGRIAHREHVVRVLAERFRGRPAAEWLRLMEGAGVPCAPVQAVREALADPVLTERDGTWTMEGATYGTVPTVASPLRLARTPATLRDPAPALGQHTEAVASRGWDAFDE